MPPGQDGEPGGQPQEAHRDCGKDGWQQNSLWFWHNSSICHWSILQVPSPFLTRSWKNSHLNWQRWSSLSQWFSNNKSNHVNFRLLGTWEILTCPGTRSRCCRKTSERSKCWKLSPWQRTNWTLSRRWNHNMCQNFEILPMTNLLDSMYHCIRQPEHNFFRTWGSWPSWRIWTFRSTSSNPFRCRCNSWRISSKFSITIQI